MPHFTKPQEGTWTEHFGLATTPVSYDDSISPETYRARARGDLPPNLAERRARRAAPEERHVLHQGAGRGASTLVIVVRDMGGEVRAFHNICRHRGNKLVWNDYPPGDQRGLPPVHLQVPRLALRP